MTLSAIPNERVKAEVLDRDSSALRILSGREKRLLPANHPRQKQEPGKNCDEEAEQYVSTKPQIEILRETPTGDKTRECNRKADFYSLPDADFLKQVRLVSGQVRQYLRDLGRLKRRGEWGFLVRHAPIHGVSPGYGQGRRSAPEGNLLNIRMEWFMRNRAIRKARKRRRRRKPGLRRKSRSKSRR
jgi:hypothetical protein